MLSWCTRITVVVDGVHPHWYWYASLPSMHKQSSLINYMSIWLNTWQYLVARQRLQFGPWLICTNLNVVDRKAKYLDAPVGYQ